MSNGKLLVLLVVVSFGHEGIPQIPRSSKNLPVEQIAARLEEMNARRDQALESYESRRVMTAEYQGSITDGQATRTVMMTYTAPDSKRFEVISSTGPELIQEAVFQRATDSEQAAAGINAKREAALTLTNYTMQLAGWQHLPIGDCYVLQVSPRTASVFAYEGKVWVQAADFAVVRIEGHPAQAPSFWITQGEFTTQFQKVSDFYFPLKTISSSQIRLGGTATFTIQYGPYRIISAARVGRSGSALSAYLQ